MQLSEMYDNSVDPIRLLLSGHIQHADLAKICDTMRNAAPGTVRNQLIDEGLIGNLGKAAMLKSRAASMMPRWARSDKAIATLIDAAKRTNEPITSDAMLKWWKSLGNAVGKKFGMNPDKVMAVVMPKVKQEGERLAAELAASSAATQTGRDQADELAALKKKLQHKKSVSDLKNKMGVSDDDDPAVVAKKQKRAQTLAKLLGIEGEVDADTILDLLGAGPEGNIGASGVDVVRRIRELRKHLQSMMGKTSKTKALSTEDAKKLLIGLAKMVMSEAYDSHSPPSGDTASNNQATGRSWWDTIKSIGSGAQKASASAFGGLASLFTRHGRDQLGGDAVNGAIRDYLIALTLSTVDKTMKQLNAHDVLDRDDRENRARDKRLNKQPATQPSTPPAQSTQPAAGQP